MTPTQPDRGTRPELVIRLIWAPGPLDGIGRRIASELMARIGSDRVMQPGALPATGTVGLWVIGPSSSDPTSSQEVQAGLDTCIEHDIPVLVVRVHGAPMPSGASWPDPYRALLVGSGYVVESGVGFEDDLRSLLAGVDQVVAPVRTAATLSIQTKVILSLGFAGVGLALVLSTTDLPRALWRLTGGRGGGPSSAVTNQRRAPTSEILENMVLVPPGRFFMGCRADSRQECDDDEVPRTRSLPAFYIDKTEVTVAAYGDCVRAGVCTVEGLDRDDFSDDAFCNWGQADRQDHPINCIVWAQADTYCRWKNKRLPTEPEWEKAARGSDGRTYPWGNRGFEGEPVANIADESMKRWHPDHPGANGYDDGYYGTSPVGRYPAGASPYGALDMVGNVYEWMADWYVEGRFRSLRGGSCGLAPELARASNRNKAAPDRRSLQVGFRCAWHDRDGGHR